MKKRKSFWFLAPFFQSVFDLLGHVSDCQLGLSWTIVCALSGIILDGLSFVKENTSTIEENSLQRILQNQPLKFD